MSEEPLVPIKDIAAHFGVSTALIRTWVREGHISSDMYIKVGTVYRFQLSAITKAMLNDKSLAQQPGEIPDEDLEEYVGDLLADPDPEQGTLEGMDIEDHPA